MASGSCALPDAKKPLGRTVAGDDKAKGLPSDHAEALVLIDAWEQELQQVGVKSPSETARQGEEVEFDGVEDRTAKTQVTLGNVVLRLQSLETLCLDRMQGFKSLQGVLDRLAKLESESTFAKQELERASVSRQAVLDRLAKLESDCAAAKRELEIASTHGVSAIPPSTMADVPGMVAVLPSLDSAEAAETNTNVKNGFSAITPATTADDPVMVAVLPSLGSAKAEVPNAEFGGFPDVNQGKPICSGVNAHCSTWDVTIMIGHNPVHGAAAVLMCVLFVLNICFQITFLVIVIRDLSVDSYNATLVSAFRSWRVNVAHDVKWFNAHTQESLATRVCTGDSALPVADKQADAYQTLRRYVGDGDATLFQLGPILSMLALLCFLLMCLKELNIILQRMRSLFVVPTGRTSFEYSSDGMCIQQMGCRRKIICGSLNIIRTGIVIMLAIYGGQYVLNAVDMETIILNSVALEIVISLDELIFEALAPAHIIETFDKGLHLADLTWPRFYGVDVAAFASVSGVVVVLALFISLHMNPHIEMLVQARDALCAGDQDFIFTMDGAGVPAWTYPQGLTEADHLKRLDLRNFPNGGSSKRKHLHDDKDATTYSGFLVEILLQQFGRPYHRSTEACTFEMCYRNVDTGEMVIHEARDDSAPCCYTKKFFVPQVRSGKFSVLSKATETTLDAISLWNPSCYDTLDITGGYTPMLKNSLADAVGWKGCGRRCPFEKPMCVDGICLNPTCTHAKPYCTDIGTAGVRARQLCPLTCKCHEPRAALAQGLPSDGCGSACWRVGDYLARMREMPCEDVQQHDPNWIDFIEQYDRVRKTWPDDWSVSSNVAIEKLREHGCKFLNSTDIIWGTPYVFNINLCVEMGSYWPVKPLSYFCPVTCGCKRGDPHCPDTCPERVQSDPQCPSYQSKLNYPSSNCPMQP